MVGAIQAQKWAKSYYLWERGRTRQEWLFMYWWQIQLFNTCLFGHFRGRCHRNGNL